MAEGLPIGPQYSVCRRQTAGRRRDFAVRPLLISRLPRQAPLIWPYRCDFLQRCKNQPPAAGKVPAGGRLVFVLLGRAFSGTSLRRAKTTFPAPVPIFQGSPAALTAAPGRLYRPKWAAHHGAAAAPLRFLGKNAAHCAGHLLGKGLVAARIKMHSVVAGMHGFVAVLKPAAHHLGRLAEQGGQRA